MATDPDCVRRLRELVENGAVPPESLRAELTVVAADVLREYDRILFTLDTERACQRDRDRLRNDEASAYRRAAETLRAECADLRAELARVERDAADVRGRAAYAVGADSLLSEARAEIARLHDVLRATARACTLPEDTAPAALPAQVEACIRDLSGQIEQLTAERDRLQRACDEGLPREVIHCPACGRRHLDGANGVEFATKPHHTHLCQHCGHIWDHGRWSFGAPDELVSPPVPWFDAPTHRGLWWAHLTHADEQERMDVVQAAQDPYGDWYLRFVGEPTPLYLANLRGAGAKVRFTPALSPTNASPITWGKAPTVAEAIAHAKAHNQWAKWPDDGPMGAWLTRSGSTVEVFELSVTDRGTVHDITHDRAWDGGGGEWLPLDANHLPCARPVVTGETHKEGNDNEFDHV